MECTSGAGPCLPCTTALQLRPSCALMRRGVAFVCDRLAAADGLASANTVRQSGAERRTLFAFGDSVAAVSRVLMQHWNEGGLAGHGGDKPGALDNHGVCHPHPAH